MSEIMNMANKIGYQNACTTLCCPKLPLFRMKIDINVGEVKEFFFCL